MNDFPHPTLVFPTRPATRLAVALELPRAAPNRPAHSTKFCGRFFLRFAAPRRSKSEFLSLGLFLVMGVFNGSAAQLPPATPAEATPIFAASFDHGLDADAARGSAKALATNVGSAPGTSGRGIAIGRSGQSVSYSTEKNFNASRGSISILVKPVGFSPSEIATSVREQYDLFRVASRDGRDRLNLVLERGVDRSFPWARLRLSTTAVRADGDGGGEDTQLSAEILKHYAPTVMIPWKSGESKNVVVTWNFDAGWMDLYLDGKPVASARDEALRKRFGEAAPTFSLGTPAGTRQVGGNSDLIEMKHAEAETAGAAATGSVVLHDLKIFDHRLSASQIADAAGVAKGGDSLVTVEPEVLYETSQLAVGLEVGPVRAHSPGELRAEIALRRGDQLMATLTTPLPKDFLEASLSPKRWEGGDAELETTIFQGAKVVAQQREKVRIEPKPEWWGNQLGMRETVLPPYTPLKSNGHNLSVWGRDYALEDSGLPSQVTTQQTAILAAPMALRLGDDGPVLSAHLKQESATDVRARWTVAGSLGPFDVSGKIEATYDGVIDYDYLLTPKAVAGPVAGLCLDIPIQRSVAEYLARKATAQAATKGVVFRLDHDFWLPHATGFNGLSNSSLWVGDTVHGLHWYTDTDEGWTSPPQRRVELKVQPARTTLRLHILADGPASPLHLQFGLLATPFRPLPADWRRMRISPMTPSGSPWLSSNIIDWETGKAFLFGNSPIVKGEASETDRRWLDQIIEQTHSRQAKFVLYSPGNGVRTFSPLHQTYQEEWDMLPRVSQDIGRLTQFTWVCPKSHYQDYFVWHLDQMLKAGKLDGVYFDQGRAYMCKNPLHGCGYRDGAAWRETGTTREKREFYRRVRQVFVDNGREPLIIAHASNDMVPATYTCVDAFFNGEEYRGQVVDDDYTRTIDDDTLRVVFDAKIMGVPIAFISEIMAGRVFKDKWTSEQLWEHLNGAAGLKATRAMFALLLPRDVIVGGCLHNVPLGERVWKIWDGLGGAQYLSERDPRLAVAPIGKRIQTGLYLKPNGGALLAVGNLSDEPQTVRVTLDPSLASLQRMKAVDVLDAKPVDVNSQTVILEIGSKDFRLVELQK